MQLLIEASVVLLAYIFGSIPSGLLIVKLSTGKDIRQVASGRTGGTNAMRAAGLGAGLITAAMDVLKGASAVWVAQAISPENQWLHILAPIAAILGHNYSIFLAERDETGRLRLRGGAGGGPTVGGAIGLWWPSFFIIVPIGVLIFWGIGYASITTLGIAVVATVIFSIRYAQGLSAWQDILYGVMATLLLLFALRPNIKALIEGRERFHGWRPWRKKEPDPPIIEKTTPKSTRQNKKTISSKKLIKSKQH
jgi:glycerol-3-phosphate acyltransferase PlsY